MSEPIICHFCNNPITKMNGTYADSLCNHHISYDPEIKVSAHRGCNTRHHNQYKKGKQILSISKRRRVLQSLGDNIFCYFCGRIIVKMNGHESESLLIHSLDGDHDNWDPENKVPTHFGCHMRYHNEGDKNPMKRPEVRAKLIGQRRTPEQCQNISKANKGKTKPWQVGDKNSMSRSGVPAKVWRTRRERYGSSGFKDPEKNKRMASERANQIWKIRKERYGPSGVKDPVEFGRRISKGMAKSNRRSVELDL